MALIGNQIRQYSDRVVLDSLTASATADYTLQLNSTDFVPSSAESLTVSLNGIIQKPQDSYTVSGSTLTFDSALTASDSIDFIIAERGITLQTPSAGSVNTEQLASSAVTTAKIADSAVTYAKSTGFGKIGQVLQTTHSGSTTVNSTTKVDTGLTGSITPSSTSSKILVSAHIINPQTATDNSSNDIGLYLFRGTTQITVMNPYTGYTATTLNLYSAPVNVLYLDSPATTSETTYKVQISNPDGGGGGGNVSVGGAGNHLMILMEVLG